MSVHGGWVLFSASGNIRSALKHVTRDVVTNFIAKNDFFGLKKIKISIFLSGGTRYFVNTMLVF